MEKRRPWLPGLAAAAGLLIPAAASAECLSGVGGRTTAEGAAVGAILGAMAGAALDRDDRRGLRNGALVGGALGAGAGCAVANEQARYAARERAVLAEARRYEDAADEYERLNTNLEGKITTARFLAARLRSEADAAEAANGALASQAREERRRAVDGLNEVNAALRDVEGQLYGLPGDDRRRPALSRQVDALRGMKTTLENILRILG